MKFSYKFSNLLGTVYRNGTIIFSQDGNSAICPVGNKISVYDLRNNRSYTLPIEARYNYCALALSPNGVLLIAAQSDGELHVINLNFRSVIYRKSLKGKIKNIQFSPDGKYFAVTKKNGVFVYGTPSVKRRVFEPFVLEKVYTGATGMTTCLHWSFDSKLIAVGAKDTSVWIYGFAKLENLKQYTCTGHRTAIVGIFFEENSYNVITISKGGHLITWECSVDSGGLIPAKSSIKDKDDKEDEEDDLPPNVEDMEKLEKEKAEEAEKSTKVHYRRSQLVFLDELLKRNKANVTAAEFYARTKMLVVAFITGDFLLLDMADNASIIHSLNISKQRITSVAINPSGDWLALGVASIGQLVVWEWQSETFVLKQQGHFNNMRVVIYSPDGQNLATGGEDGKVKLWSSQSSFCFVTFTEHKAPITDLAFTQSGRAILSSSLDGTVRAFDLTRYRNFKTLTSPQLAQFSCLSVDSSGELVAAGGQDSHSIYLWSLQTGQLLEVLGGHDGPVVSVQFSREPGSTLLVSTAWDATLKVWDAIATTTAKESIALSSDGMCVRIRPDGKQVAVATMDGHVTMFNPLTGQQEGNIIGTDHLGVGRADNDKITAQKNRESRCFTSICYSSDGQYLLAGGQGKNVCIYSVQDELLIKKFEITQNRSFDGMDETISRRKMAENGVNLAMIEYRRGKGVQLPGTKNGDMSLRGFRPEIRVSSLTFSPTGRSWAATSSEGLLVYSLDTNMFFDPLDLDSSNTPSAVKKKLKEQDYATALMMAVRININSLKQEVLETIPFKSVNVIVSNLPQLYVESVLGYISEALETTPHVGLYAYWATTLVTQHGNTLKTRAPQITSMLNALQKTFTIHRSNLSKVCTNNEYMLNFILSQASLRKKRRKTEPLPDIEVSDDDMCSDGDEKNMEVLFSDGES